MAAVSGPGNTDLQYQHINDLLMFWLLMLKSLGKKKLYLLLFLITNKIN